MKNFQNEHKLSELMRVIAEIDIDRNGYVTLTELDDILKMLFPELANRNLKSILMPFSSSANKVLIDYKRLRDSILEALSLTKDGYA